MTFAWTPDLSVGIAAIDTQHQELFQRANALLVAVGGRRQEHEVLATLAFLGDYIVTHFDDEERLMRAAAYPGLPVQRAEHEQFAGAFRQLRTKFARHGIDALLAQDIQTEVCDWLVRHVQGTDRELGAWLSARKTADRSA